MVIEDRLGLRDMIIREMESILILISAVLPNLSKAK
jgi:hypothetical protein